MCFKFGEMPDSDLVIRGRQVVISGTSSEGAPNQCRLAPASVHIRDGRIVYLGSFDEVPTGCEVVTADDGSFVIPGLVDTHVHVNEPGRTDWEGFVTATSAAAAGGVTTVIDMPLNSIPATTTLSAFHEKLSSAQGRCYVDVGFWGGVVPGNTHELAPLFESGVVGFKCFLVPSGVDEFPNVMEEDLRKAFPELVRLGATLIVHAELPGPIEHASATSVSNVDNRRYQNFLDSRPAAAENEAVALMIRLSREFGSPVHIVHHSSAEALPMLRQARREGVMITVETCPHYLVLFAEEIPDGATEFKCCPPIRERKNCEQLWQALFEDTIDLVVSDHSPCPPELKARASGDFQEAWGGISSLQLRLPVMWTGAQSRGVSLMELVQWLCVRPAKLVGLEHRKGRLAVGFDADVAIWNPREEFRVTADIIHHKHKVTPYTGQSLRGVVQKTFLRGRKIYDDGAISSAPRGVLLKRPFES